MVVESKRGGRRTLEPWFEVADNVSAGLQRIQISPAVWTGVKLFISRQKIRQLLFIMLAELFDKQ